MSDKSLKPTTTRRLLSWEIALIVVSVVIIVFLVIFLPLYFMNGQTLRYPPKIKSGTKFTMIAFYTEGGNRDNGKNLSKEAFHFKRLFESEVDNLTLYTPRICSSLDASFDELFIEYENKFVHPEHYRGNKHGFWAWKPFVIAHQLSMMKDDDILIYHDMNTTRYPYYQNFSRPLKHIVYKLLEVAQADISVPFENPEYLHLKHHVKQEVLSTIGGNIEEFKNWPLLNANRIFIRKSQFSVDLVNEWLELCKQKELLLPEQTAQKDLRWHTHDQALLSTLCRKKVMEGKLPQNWPGYFLRDKLLLFDHVALVKINSRHK